LTSSFFESIFFAFVEEIRFGAPKIDNFWTSVSVLLLYRAFLAVVSIGNAGSAVNHAPSLIRAVVTLVANSHERAWTHVRVANDAFSIALFAESADGDPWLFAAEDQIRMMLCHPSPLSFSTPRPPMGSIQQSLCSCRLGRLYTSFTVKIQFYFKQIETTQL